MTDMVGQWWGFSFRQEGGSGECLPLKSYLSPNSGKWESQTGGFVDKSILDKGDGSKGKVPEIRMSIIWLRPRKKACLAGLL